MLGGGIMAKSLLQGLAGAGSKAMAGIAAQRAAGKARKAWNSMERAPVDWSTATDDLGQLGMSKADKGPRRIQFKPAVEEDGRFARTGVPDRPSMEEPLSPLSPVDTPPGAPRVGRDAGDPFDYMDRKDLEQMVPGGIRPASAAPATPSDAIRRQFNLGSDQPVGIRPPPTQMGPYPVAQDRTFYAEAGTNFPPDRIRPFEDYRGLRDGVQGPREHVVLDDNWTMTPPSGYVLPKKEGPFYPTRDNLNNRATVSPPFSTQSPTMQEEPLKFRIEDRATTAALPGYKPHRFTDYLPPENTPTDPSEWSTQLPMPVQYGNKPGIRNTAFSKKYWKPQDQWDTSTTITGRDPTMGRQFDQDPAYRRYWQGIMRTGK